MKRLITFLAICLGCCFALPAQDVWKPVNAPGYILAVDNNGYLYSTSFELGECLCRSTDEGLTWDPILTGSFYDGPQMTVSKQGRIFAIPNLGTKVYYSDNNGDTWQTTSNFPACLVEGIFAVSNDTLLIWGISTFGYENLHFTLDGGATWSTADLTPMGQTHHIGDVIANEVGDVFVSFWSNNTQDDGIYSSSYTDMEHWNWQLVAFPNISIKDMEFDPDGNVVAVASAGEFTGFQQIPGFYLAGNEAESLGIADNGTVYICNKHGDHAVLASSQDNGAHFHEMGEMLPISLEEPDGSLFRGYDNYLYFYGNSYYWKSFDEAGFIGGQHTFAPQGAEWYFNINPDMFQVPVSYYRMEVLGDTLIQGHQCSVITPPYISDGENQYVYEEDRKVYWYNPTLDAFTTLYDFDAEVGGSWICEVGECSCEIRVNSIENVVYGGRTYRVQNVESVDGDYYAFFSRIIDGIGSVEGLFPYSDACTGIIYDGPYPDFLRCYLVDGEMLYHEGTYACDAVYPWNTTCWDGTVAESYEGGDGTEENPYQIATPQQLALLAERTYNGTESNAYYILVDDICLNDEDGRLEWPMIGKQDEMNHPVPFQGVFDGNGHSIKGMYIGVYHINSGLFGEVSNAVIKNLIVDDSKILNGNGMGIIIGHAQNTDILNCSVANCELINSVSSGGQGGIVGDAFAANDEAHTFFIKDCTSDVRFSSNGSYYSCGGIVGYACAQKSVLVIENCVNYSNIIVGEHLGGILGTGGVIGNDESSAFVIRKCKNYGEISSGQFCGGIVGYCWDIKASRCFNWGDVTAEYNAGGIMGINMNGIVAECANMGNVKTVSTSGSMVGGIVADHSGGVVANSYNRGEVSAIYGDPARDVTTIGGIVGRSTGSIYNVYNAGAISIPEMPFNSRCGAILGQGDVSDHYLNCYWLEQDTLPACGNIELLGSSSFIPSSYFFEWELNEPQYGHYDLLSVLNFGAEVVLDSVPGYPYLVTWRADLANTNQGFPILSSEPELPDTIQSGDLLYSIISINPPCMRVIGHVDGENAQGEIVIPETVDYEGDTYVVTEVGERAFNYCRSLVSIDVANTVTRIGSRAFYDCDNLQSIHLPDSLEAVSSEMLFGCSSLTEVSLPSTITEIGEGAFSGCRGLTEIVLPDGVSAIRNEAFSSCVQLHSITFPETMVSIGRLAFFNCDSLMSVTLPQGLTTISELLFLSCGSLENVVIPESVTSIEMGAFESCRNLNAIVVPDSVETIGRSAFESCSSLSLVELGSSVSYLAEEVFLINSLDVRLSLICHNPVPAQCCANTFPDESHQGVIMVPCGTEEVYRQTWGDSWTSGNFEEDCGNGLIEFHGSEWYYEIVDEYGNVTYQHLEYVADTTVNHKDVQIIIRTNTLYDKGEHQEVTREYLYVEDEIVYWWNSELEEFTVLYDLGAQQGDSWVIKVGTETLTMHVDAVEQYYYEGQSLRMLRVSDENDLFDGNIVCSIGHLSSFFPERLMTRGKDYRVHGLRCYWNYGNLAFTVNRDDCGAIYANLHNGIEEDGPSTGSGAFVVYPNPTHGVLFVQTLRATSLQAETVYRITNMMGQTLMTGQITAETQQIDVSILPQGMYFITVGDGTGKFVVEK